MLKIRHAREDEKRKCYEWLYHSDTTALHSGPPDYPDNSIAGWEEFLEDFEEFYFQREGQMKGSVMIIEADGVEIGALCYAAFHLRPGAAEFDIWLRAREFCGKGLGSGALRMAIDYLHEEKGFNEFIIRPAERNIGALKGYMKAGFRPVDNREQAVKNYLLPQFIEEYGPGDHGWEETAFLERMLHNL